MYKAQVAFLFLVLTTVFSCVDAKLIIDATILPGASGTPSQTALNAFIASVNQKTITAVGGLPVLAVTDAAATSGTTTQGSSATSGTSAGTTGVPGTTGLASSGSLFSNSVTLLFTALSLLLFAHFPSEFLPKRQTIIAVFFLYLVSSSYALTGYNSCKLLNEELNYKLYWTINTAEQAIYVGQEATLPSGAGWLAFGISPNGRMNGGGGSSFADIIHGYAGTTSMSDMSTNIYNKPGLDSQQDATIIKTAKTGNTISLEWKRQLSTGDTLNDYVIDPNNLTTIIWAALDGANPASPNTFAIHSHKSSYGGEAIQFSQTYNCPGAQSGESHFRIEVTGRLVSFNQPSFAAGLAQALNVVISRIVIQNVQEIEDVFCPECEVVDLVYPSYSVPATQTTYVYRGFDLPAGVAKHIVRFESIRDNSQVLHHIVLYTDPSGVALNNTYGYDQPVAAKPIFAWAPGSDRFDLPEGVGFAVRSGVTNKHVIVGMHYNNPTSQTGLTDSSGIRLYLNTTRANSAGFMWLGVGTQFPANSTASPSLVANRLPNGFSSLHYTSSCRDNITYGALSTTKQMNIFAYFNHMHTYGRVMWTDWIRTSLGPGGSLVKTYLRKLGEILDYHYDEQKFVALSTPQVMIGGDTLLTHCVFDTRAASAPVVGGEATFDEMCLQGIMYYPDYGFEGCSFELKGYGNCSHPCGDSLFSYV